MVEIIGLFFLVAWYAVWCVGLYTTLRWVWTRKVVKRMWDMRTVRIVGNIVKYALIAVAVISIIYTLMTEQETTADLPQLRYEWPSPFDWDV